MKLKDPNDLSVEEISFILQSEPLITAWLAAVAGRADVLLRQGHNVPGFKLVQGRAGNRQWDDSVPAEAIISVLREETTATLDDVAPRKVISPTDAEKMFKARLGRGSKWREPFERVQRFITRAPGKLTLAPLTDPRPEVRPAQLDFQDDTL